MSSKKNQLCDPCLSPNENKPFDIDNESVRSYLDTKSELEQNAAALNDAEGSTDLIEGNENDPNVDREHLGYKSFNDYDNYPNSQKEDIRKKFEENLKLNEQLETRDRGGEAEGKAVENREDTSVPVRKNEQAEGSQELMFIIKNLDTGEKSDIRNVNQLNSKIDEKQLKLLPREKAWDLYWKEVKKRSMEILDAVDAVESGDFEKVKLLIEESEKLSMLVINARHHDRWTFLHYSASNGNAKIARLLLDHDADIEAETYEGKRALHIACLRGHAELASVLLEKKAKVNVQDKSFYAPIHYAAENGHLNLVKLLLENGADVSLKNYRGMKPIDLAWDFEVRNILEDTKPGSMKSFEEEDRYGRFSLGRTVLSNSRADHVEKLLFMTNKEFKSQIAVKKLTESSSEDVINVELPDRNGVPASGSQTTKNNNLHEPHHSKSQLDVPKKGSPWKNLKKEESADTKKENDFKEKEKPIAAKQASGDLPEDDKKEKFQGSKTPSGNSLKNFGKMSKIFIFNIFKDRDQPDAGKEKITHESFNYLKLLGKGSFGEVYLVEKKNSKKLYAMKILQKDRIVNQNLTRYAQTERNVLSIMSHPFIVKLNFAFQNESKLFLVMDFCEGGDLGKLLQRKRKLPENIAKIYICEVILALEALHKKLIIFRDLKPDNVVLDKDGHALLTDFGLSKEGIEDNMSRSFCGSVAYLAPEMLSRTGHGRTVDWYLVGVLLYELLVGIPPYYSNNRDQLFENIKRGPLMLPKTLSEEVKSLIKALLCRNPNTRLGAINDSEDIKGHPWFSDINWEDVLNKKLTPPPLDLKPEKPGGNLPVNFDDAEKKIKHHIKDWSFVAPDDEDYLEHETAGEKWESEVGCRAALLKEITKTLINTVK